MPKLDDFKRKYLQRQKSEEGEPDIYKYEDVPDFLRRQMTILIQKKNRHGACAEIHHSYFLEDREYHQLSLQVKEDSYQPSPEHIVRTVLLNCDWLLFVSLIETFVKEIGEKQLMNEVNRLFRNSCFGYELHYEREHLPPGSGPYGRGGWRNRFTMMKKDEEFIHAEVVRPALQLISDTRFRAAQNEYLEAHSAYLTGDYNKALQEACKAYESVLKIACDINNYNYQKDKDTVRKLVQILFENDFFPSYMQGYATHVGKILDSSVNTIRNKEAGHGKGIKHREPSEAITKLGMHTTASLIVFVIDRVNE